MYLGTLLSRRLYNKFQFILNIADIKFAIISQFPLEKINLGKSFYSFIHPKSFDEKEIVKIHVYYGDFPKINLPGDTALFSAKGVWSLHKINKKNVFILEARKRFQKKIQILAKYANQAFLFKSISLDKKFTMMKLALPYRVAVFNPGFLNGSIYINVKHPRLMPNPIRHPLLEIILWNLLALRRGAMFHACAVIDKGKGYLFLGHSGSGKSTMAKLWKGPASVLQEERVVVREKDGKFLMYAIPGHGSDLQSGLNGKINKGFTLHKIFFLNHGLNNAACLENKAKAICSLLLYCYPPFWSEGNVNYTLDLCSNLIQKIPSYNLNFVPDSRIIDFIRHIEE